jgi:replicative DNA helicase
MNPEIAILSQLVQDDQLYYKMSLSTEHFTDPHNRKAFQAIEKMIGDGVKVDQVSLSEYIPAAQAVSLHDAVPTTANWQYYHKALQEKHKKYIASEIARKIHAQLKDNTDSTDIFQTIEDGLQSAADKGSDYTIEKLGDTLLEYVNIIEERKKSGGDIPGIRCGLPKLDDLTLGWNPRRYYIIGARPGKGKTALLLNFARYAGLKGIPVGIFSLESSKYELDGRIMADVGNIDSQRLAFGDLREHEFHDITVAAGQISDSPIYVYDQPNTDLITLRAQARRMVRQFGVKAIFVDYAQIIEHRVPSGNKFEAKGEVSLAMKQLARDLDVPMVVAAQLRRDTENKRPTIADISDSSQFEKDADAIVFIHHEFDDNGEIEKSWLLLEKNRDGPVKAVPVYFRKEYVRFGARIGGE